MTEEKSERDRKRRSMYTLAMVFLMQDAPSAKKLFPILAGGTAVGVALISVISQAK